MKRRIKALETLASEMIGDGKIPQLYFVSFDKAGVVMITRSLATAHAHWLYLAAIHPNQESTLEDRKHGCLCAVEFSTEKARWVKYDDAHKYVGITMGY